MPSFFVAQFSVTNADALAAYSQKAAGIMKRFGGKLVFKGSAEDRLFGSSGHSNIAVFAFPTPSLLSDFYACQDYRDLEDLRSRGADMVLSACVAPAAE